LDNKLAYYPKVFKSETIPAFVLMGLIVFLGIQPNYLVRWIEPTTNSMVATLSGQPKPSFVFKKSPQNSSKTNWLNRGKSIS
jgi:NAD(P)H-quinone oxidoreductase subunit 4